MPKAPDRTQPGHLLVKGVPPLDGPIRPSRPVRGVGVSDGPIALPPFPPTRNSVS